MVRLNSIIAEIDRIWPISGADAWDNVGLLVGDPNAEVKSVSLAVDITDSTVEEAISARAQLLIAHHPLMLSGLKSIVTSESTGRTIHRAIRSELAIFALHTNADHPEFGVSEALAKTLGLAELVPLDEATGHGRVGRVSPQPLREFAAQIASRLPHCNAPIRVSGHSERIIERVAVLAGSGGTFAPQALSAGVDAFITSDLKHHQALDFLAAREAGDLPPALIDISHWAAERPWLELVPEKLNKALPELSFHISKVATDPWTFSVQS